jgi:MYXO-CTERM domain-containing protein
MSNGGGTDAFIFRLSSGGDQMLFSTYLGGGSDDAAAGLALRPTTGGGPVIVGQTFSTDFPTTPGVVDRNWHPGWDAYVAELSDTGALTFSTYLAGDGDDFAVAVAQGPTGGPWVAGRTTSSDFPTRGGPLQGTGPGAGDAFVTQLHAGGSALDYSTYLGGTDDDRALGIAIDGSGGVYVVGQAGAGFPSVTGSYRNPGAPADAFAAKLTSVADGGADGGVDGGADAGADGGDGGQGDGGVPGRPLDALGCSCAVGFSGSTAFAFALLVAIAARSRQRRKPTSAPPSQ